MRMALTAFVVSLSSVALVNASEAAARSTTSPFAADATVVYVATSSGVYAWSPKHSTYELICDFAAYELELSPQGELLIGNGGADSAASGVTTSGVWRMDVELCELVKLSDLPADDLEFDAAGNLYVSNKDGIHRLDAHGDEVRVSTNPTSQFAFDHLAEELSVITTNGGAYGGLFGIGTDIINLVTDTATHLTDAGGEDVQVLPDGVILFSGTDGLFELERSGQWTKIYAGVSVFDLQPHPVAQLIYFGNTEAYDSHPFGRGLFEFDPSTSSHVQLVDEDINSIEIMVPPVVTEVVPPRQRYDDQRTATIRGHGFSVGEIEDVLFAGASASDVVVVDDTAIVCMPPTGDFGPAEVTVSSSHGSGDLVDGFTYTPAILLEGDFRIGGHLTARYLCDPGDGLFAILGLPPVQSIETPPFDGQLCIVPFYTFFILTGWPFDTWDQTFGIPNNPNLSGLEVLFQALVGPSFKHPKDAAWTNCATLSIQ